MPRLGSASSSSPNPSPNPLPSPSDSPSRLVEISKSSNAFSSLPHRVFRYISTHTKESLFALSVLGLAIVIKKKPSLLLYPIVLATVAGAAKKAVAHFRKTVINEDKASHDAKDLDPVAGKAKLRALKSRSKPPNIQEFQDSYVLAFLTDQLLTPGSKAASIVKDKGEALYKEALAKLAPKISTTDFNIRLYDILVELNLLDPTIEHIETSPTRYSNHQIHECLLDTILKLISTNRERNIPVGAHLQLCNLSFGIYR